jgi:hypothetical protein
MSLTAATGGWFVIQVSPDLMNWSDVSNVFATNGTILFIDNSTTNAAKFYRTRIGP